MTSVLQETEAIYPFPQKVVRVQRRMQGSIEGLGPRFYKQPRPKLLHRDICQVSKENISQGRGSTVSILKTIEAKNLAQRFQSTKKCLLVKYTDPMAVVYPWNRGHRTYIPLIGLESRYIFSHKIQKCYRVMLCFSFF